LLWSPLNVKECWPDLPLLLLAKLPEELDELELPLMDGLRSVHGTATCFPDELFAETSPDELLDALLLLLELFPDEESDITAKSIFPDDGLTRTSLIVPIFWPDEVVMGELCNSDTRTS